MFLDELKEALALQARKDKKDMLRAKERLDSNKISDKIFQKKTEEAYRIIDKRALDIARILKYYVTGPIEGPLCEHVFGKPCKKKEIIRTLKDKNFTAFLIQSNLLGRTRILSDKSKGEVKIRLYWAILNFQEIAK